MAKSGNCKLTGKYYPSLDEHHTIPREFGGENSLTIFIGPDIHQTLHRSVNNPKVFDEFLSMIPSQNRKFARELVELIRKAKESVDKSKKSKTVELEIDYDTYEKLEIAAKDKGMRVKAFLQVLISKLVNSK